MNLRTIMVMCLLTIIAMPVMGAMDDNGSIIPSAKRGAEILPDSAKSGIGDIIDLAMYIVAIVAVLSAIFAAGIAFYSKDTDKKNKGLTWLGYIVAISLLLGVVFAIINTFLFA